MKDGPPIKENHWQCGWDDRSFLNVDHYNERGLDPNYFWQRIFFKPTPSNEDMEMARLEACRVFLNMGGHVIITIMDSLAIPENDRNSPYDGRPGVPIDHYEFGWPIQPKMKTGDPGNQYYDWKQETDYSSRLTKVGQMLYEEKRKNGHKHKPERKRRPNVGYVPFGD